MGISTSWAQLDAKLEALARDVADMPKGQVGRSALATKKSVQVFMPERLRGVGKKGARLDVRYVESGSGAGAQARVFVTGPAQLIENDTKAHPIPRFTGSRASKKTGLTKLYGPAFGQDKNQKSVAFAGIVRRRVWHPGTKGQHPWAKGVEAALPLIYREFDAAGALLLRRHF